MVDYLDEMISATPVEVIADFTPALFAHDQSAALPALAGIPTAIVAGDKDRMTPLDRSQAIADALPDAEFVVAEGSGHMAMMEDPTLTNDALRRMLQPRGGARRDAADRGADRPPAGQRRQRRDSWTRRSADVDAPSRSGVALGSGCGRAISSSSAGRWAPARRR